ncbi:hypothetical protein, partial [Cytobacillus firmus]|uniref:hypothetical protein n=1 Tax=Cytobacillus firmus TaxID=1399 RepID=UPI002FFFF584
HPKMDREVAQKVEKSIKRSSAPSADWPGDSRPRANPASINESGSRSKTIRSPPAGSKSAE